MLLLQLHGAVTEDCRTGRVTVAACSCTACFARPQLVALCSGSRYATALRQLSLRGCCRFWQCKESMVRLLSRCCDCCKILVVSTLRAYLGADSSDNSSCGSRSHSKPVTFLPGKVCRHDAGVVGGTSTGTVDCNAALRPTQIAVCEVDAGGANGQQQLQQLRTAAAPVDIRKHAPCRVELRATAATEAAGQLQRQQCKRDHSCAAGQQLKL
jgi:hypothetical protein